MVFTEDEIYTLNGDRQHLSGFDPKYLNIVDYILKITEDIWEKKQIHVINETYTNDVIIHTGAEIINGINTVIQGTINTLMSFPDRLMGAEAVVWSEDSVGKFFSSHRIGSYATNLGTTKYGEPTGKKIFFRTIADCAVQNNKIYEEWLVRDNISILTQLGYDPIEQAKKETKYNNRRSLAYKLRGEMNPKNGVRLETSEKFIYDLMYEVWGDNSFSNIAQYYAEKANVFTVDGQELNLKEHIEFLNKVLRSFSDTNFEIQRITKNRVSSSKEEIAVRWKLSGVHDQEGYFGAPSFVPVMFYGVTHFILEDNKIIEEYCIFDAYDILCQIHAGQDEELEPNDINISDHIVSNKRLAATMIDAINTAMNDGVGLEEIIAAFLSPSVKTVVSDPIGTLDGVHGQYDGFWKGLVHSFPDLEVQPYILIGGEFNGKQAVSIAGNIVGIFKEDWLGIPANNQPTYLRFSSQLIYKDGEVVDQWIYLDILSVISQVGYNLFPVRGVDQIVPISKAQNGIKLDEGNAQVSAQSVNLVNDMIDGLLRYDQKNIASMEMHRFWDVDNMMWYGPSGIGSTRGLKGFQDYHQIPFLKAFPDRGVNDNDSYVNIGDEDYVCHFGHDAMYGTHTGDGWLGLEASGNKFTMSVQDFWRCENGKLVENWVMLDLVNVLKQLGVDVFQLLNDKIDSVGKG